MMDIATKELLLEEALRASKEAYRFLTEFIPQQVWTAGPDGRLDYVNGPLLEYFGKTSEEVLDEGWQHAIHPSDVAVGAARWAAALERGTPYEIEIRLRRADGEYRWHLSRARPLRDAGGAVIRWFGTNTDIDDQKRVGQAQRFIIEASSVLAASMDYEATLASVARLAVPHIADWIGVDLVEGGELRSVAVAHADPSKVALARELQARYPADPSLKTGAPHVIRTGRSELIPDIPDALLIAAARDEEHLHLMRELKLTSAMIVPLRTRDRTIGAITLASAESGRRFDAEDLPLAEELARRCALAIENATLLRQAQAAEQELRRVNEDLERRVAERTTELKRAKERVEEANARLKEMDTMKDDFLGALSYQLASPINAVLGYSDLLLEGAGGALREDQRRYVRRITGSSRVLLSLVHDLLDMSRMSAGKFQLELDPTDLCASVREALGYLEPLTEMQGLRVVSRLSDEPALAQADPQRIEQVLATLLHSAMQLTPSGGLLRAAVERSPGGVRFELYHTGTSLHAADIAQIFRRFTRLGGAWLGLSIARSIIEAHQGSMGVEPSTGGGNTFWFTLPAAPPERAEEEEE